MKAPARDPFSGGAPWGKGDSQLGGFQAILRVRLSKWQGMHQGGGETWRNFLADSRLQWFSVLSKGHQGHLKAAVLEQTESGLGFFMPGLEVHLGCRGRLAPRLDGLVSADFSRNGHPTDSSSPTSDPLLCPTPRRGLSAPE